MNTEKYVRGYMLVCFNIATFSYFCMSYNIYLNFRYTQNLFKMYRVRVPMANEMEDY